MTPAGFRHFLFGCALLVPFQDPISVQQLVGQIHVLFILPSILSFVDSSSMHSFIPFLSFPFLSFHPFHSSMNAWIRASIHACICAYVQTYIQTYVAMGSMNTMIIMVTITCIALLFHLFQHVGLVLYIYIRLH